MRDEDRFLTHSRQRSPRTSASWATRLRRNFIERNRKIADALAGRVINRVGDRRGNADDADLAQAFDAEAIDNRVGLFHEDHFDVVHVGIHRHMVLSNVGVHDPPEAVVV